MRRREGELTSQLDRVRLHADALYGVIAAVSSSPDLPALLRGVVALTTRAADCHASFVYLRNRSRLQLRAASGPYERLIGQIEFSVDQGLAGWALRNRRTALIRERALEDPRTHYVPELEEERFQSMIAVPIPSRAGEPLGVLVLHTVAPREFDHDTVNVLTHTASLVAGAIENAQLYEAQRRRVEELTSLARLSQRIAGVSVRDELYRVATSGLLELLDATMVALYTRDGESAELELAAAAPSVDSAPHPTAADAALLGELARTGQLASTLSSRAWSAAIGPSVEQGVLAAPVTAAEDEFGVLVVARDELVSSDSEELLRAVAGQLAIALQKARLIERLTDENVARDMLRALEAQDADTAMARAASAGIDLTQPYLLVHALPVIDGRWREVSPLVEAAMHRLVPRARCHVDGDAFWALLPTAGARARTDLLDALANLGSTQHVALGVSDTHRGPQDGRTARDQARCAARVALKLAPAGGALSFDQLGAYRYLIAIADNHAPRGRLDAAIQTLADYDRKRRASLLQTLERYLADGRNVTRTAHELTIHPNTLRQRLERIESLTDLRLKDEDLLALELAVKLARLGPLAHSG